MTEIVNFYEELGLGRDDSVEQIREELKGLKLQLSAKVGRPSSQREKWMRQLALIDEAQDAFRDEDAREQYDITLRRRPESTGEEPAIDWTSRAWNYYYIGDNGAARVAARKAKEQSPGAAMPFVVSAWVLLKEDEPRQAKQDADEAFVLDELTMDSVDVQEVRGTVYFLLKDYERALTSFDRALVKATDGEKPSLLWRRALTYDGMNQPEKALESALAGLSQGVEQVATVRDNLEQVAAHSIHRLDSLDDPAESIARLKARKDALQSSETDSMDQESRARILGNVESNIEACQREQDLREQHAKAESVRSPSGTQPEVSLGSLGCGTLIAFVVGGGLAVASPGLGVPLLVVLLGALGVYAWIQFSKRSEWANQQLAYEAAQKRLIEIAREHNDELPDRPIPLKRAIES